MKPSIINVNTTDLSLQRTKSNLGDAINYLLNNALSESVLKKDVIFSINADNTLAHGLGRTYQGFIVVNKNNYGDVKRSDTINNDKSKQIILQSNANMVCDILIF